MALRQENRKAHLMFEGDIVMWAHTWTYHQNYSWIHRWAEGMCHRVPKPLSVSISSHLHLLVPTMPMVVLSHQGSSKRRLINLVPMTLTWKGTVISLPYGCGGPKKRMGLLQLSSKLYLCVHSLLQSTFMVLWGAMQPQQVPGVEKSC